MGYPVDEGGFLSGWGVGSGHGIGPATIRARWEERMRLVALRQGYDMPAPPETERPRPKPGPFIIGCQLTAGVFSR